MNPTAYSRLAVGPATPDYVCEIESMVLYRFCVPKGKSLHESSSPLAKMLIRLSPPGEREPRSAGSPGFAYDRNLILAVGNRVPPKVASWRRHLYEFSCDLWYRAYGHVGFVGPREVAEVYRKTRQETRAKLSPTSDNAPYVVLPVRFPRVLAISAVTPVTLSSIAYPSGGCLSRSRPWPQWITGRLRR